MRDTREKLEQVSKLPYNRPARILRSVFFKIKKNGSITYRNFVRSTMANIAGHFCFSWKIPDNRKQTKPVCCRKKLKKLTIKFRFVVHVIYLAFILL